MQQKDIFERERTGEIISIDDPEYWRIAELITEAQKVIAEMNTGYRTPQEVRELFERLTGAPVDPSFWMLPPFYTDFGKNIRVGKNVFINHGCEFMDRGGITLEDNVLVGPKVNLITINHPVEPSRRRSTFCAPIVIERNAWIGVGASIMPGVTIGENAIVAANAVVTKAVAANTIVGGIPAKVITTFQAEKTPLDGDQRTQLSSQWPEFIEHGKKENRQAVRLRAMRSLGVLSGMLVLNEAKPPTMRCLHRAL